MDDSRDFWVVGGERDGATGEDGEFCDFGGGEEVVQGGGADEAGGAGEDEVHG